jgi:hypothetical protein
LSRREVTAGGGDSRITRRYATLASVEIVEDDDGGRGGGPTTVVRLVGVGRAFLRDYVLSSESGGGTTMDLAGRASEVDVVAGKHSGGAPPTDGAPQTATLSKGVGDDVPIWRELEAMENYGLGSYGILSTIPDLARQLMSQLGPYYGTVHRGRGEYEAEVASMAVLRTLEDYATPAELAVGLLAPCATR